ncbi:hypothetical protein [Nocardia spumae]|uniref:hypothetical protein n=1 Tax=Nocardia spumae TaxID=2887190 RepID=UPI001D142B78|nr:hypothetical protein [Nocardia spumae]
MVVHTETAVVLFSGGLIFLSALVLGVWKWQAMTASANGLAHPYIDIAHRAALMYSFAVVLISLFVELSGWPAVVNSVAAGAMIAMFVITIANYVRLGLRGETDNQMHNAPPSMRVILALLIVGEIGGFLVLLTGFAAGRF